MKNLIVLFVVAIVHGSYAQKNCEGIANSPLYFSAAATAATESEARGNALSMLAENISSVVSSKTDMITTGDRQTYFNTSKSTSVLHLKGVSYLTCSRKKNGVTVTAFVSKKDLELSSSEVASRVRQYFQLMEQKETQGLDVLPDAYTAYLYTFMSPYTIGYTSDARHISNVRDYLQSYLRTYLSNINITCTGVRENPDYPDQQLTLALSLAGTENTHMKFLLDLPEFGARGNFDYSDNTMDVIMTPDGRKTRFTGKLTLAPPPVEADLKDISEHVQISREVSFEADMSEVIKLDFNSQVIGNRMQLTPAIRHLAVRQFEWLSEGKLLSSEQKANIPAAGLKEVTLRLNASDELTATKTFDAPLTKNMRSAIGDSSPSLVVEQISNHLTAVEEAHELLKSTPYPEDAMVFVQTDMPNLVFSSSMSAMDRQYYNYVAARYEIYLKPLKQLLFVESGGLVKKSMGVINLQPGEVMSFRIKALLPEPQVTKGLVSILSEPGDASIFVNDIQTAYRTPFTVMLAEGITKISIHKNYYHSVDTVIRVDAANPMELNFTLKRMPGTTNDALSYLRQPHERNYYRELEPEPDPVQVEAAQRNAEYRRQSYSLKRKATLAYSTAAIFIPMGIYYHWFDRMIYDSRTGHSPVLRTLGDASYVIGGVGLIAGIIYSSKLSHLKKNWQLEPVVNPGGAGVSVTYRFK